MENKVYTQDELRRENILTDEYALNLEPGEFIARLDLKAETPRRNNCLRLFFTFEDGRKVMSTAHWWQRYIGFMETPADTRMRLTYGKTTRGEVYLTGAEVLTETALTQQASPL